MHLSAPKEKMILSIVEKAALCFPCFPCDLHLYANPSTMTTCTAKTNTYYYQMYTSAIFSCHVRLWREVGPWLLCLEAFLSRCLEATYGVTFLCPSVGITFRNYSFERNRLSPSGKSVTSVWCTAAELLLSFSWGRNKIWSYSGCTSPRLDNWE